MRNTVLLALGSSVLGGSLLAKPLPAMKTENGKMTEEAKSQVMKDIAWGEANMTDAHYANIVKDPQLARNDQERMTALKAREIFVLIDRSGSMSEEDKNPTGGSDEGWTRWKSAKMAAESIAELAILLDTDNKVDVTFFNMERLNQPNLVHEQITHPSQLSALFSKYTPTGATPTFEALEDLYTRKLQALLLKGEPFTTVILTDGSPSGSAMQIKQFFKKIIKENRLEEKGRETLAAFTFVQMGDDSMAGKFLEDLDDNLITEMGITIDIVDTKEDNFLFGTGKHKGKESGPLALFWDVLFNS